MTLLESLPPSYEYLITALETKSREELTMDYVTTRLMHEVSKLKEKDPQSEDAAMMLRQGKMDTSSSRQSGRTCFYCGKPGHIVRFCYKAKNKEREHAKIVKDDHDFAFTVQHTSYARSMSEWIMDSGATKHMISYWLTFDTYEIYAVNLVHQVNHIHSVYLYNMQVIQIALPRCNGKGMIIGSPNDAFVDVELYFQTA
ncbi:hypothetical protein AXG93_942s1160 [Marchantia polymorpha subsp. ruderalis]|uniref:CCHC-type domain-containing protein n=1 Tax=Marchantia polymorpha subsp. ruderalis TaxID=1480154 RepID=A0A176WCT1_MARPO|nr:hypothetical protein AXG93_942s1160 [Marchantia polymorpha subsp. ruderalis]